jgi:DNA adenine methylase
MKTPLRYPGGKSRAVKYILPHIPEDVPRLCSPFFGGGSVELAVANRGTEVVGYDKMKQLVWFWQGLCGDNNRLADEVERLREQYTIRNGDTVTGCSKDSFHQYREDLKIETFMFSYERAAKYYAINRASFSGATFSGGWSERASYARFTESSVQRIRDFKAQNFRVDYADFEYAILWHPKAFLYLDPPYLLQGSQNSLYGVNGQLHSGFDHQKLYELLSDRTDWVMSYNDCKEIRDLYCDRKIIEAKWAYGMKNIGKKTMGSSSEILIIG